MEAVVIWSKDYARLLLAHCGPKCGPRTMGRSDYGQCKSELAECPSEYTGLTLFILTPICADGLSSESEPPLREDVWDFILLAPLLLCELNWCWVELEWEECICVVLFPGLCLTLSHSFFDCMQVGRLYFTLNSESPPSSHKESRGEGCFFSFTHSSQIFTFFSTQTKLFSVPTHIRLISTSTYILLVWLVWW